MTTSYISYSFLIVHLALLLQTYLSNSFSFHFLQCNKIKHPIITQRSSICKFPKETSTLQSLSKRSFQLKSNNDGFSSDESNNELETVNNRELLLQLHISINHDNSNNAVDIMEKIRTYLRSFPFAAILPVQPLTYVPSDNGVDVTFLRKKTQEKGSVDGGILIGVNMVQNDDEALSDSSMNNCALCLIAKRNSDGQVVQKVFSEKIVVMQLLKGIDKKQTDLGFQVESVFHRWM